MRFWYMVYYQGSTAKVKPWRIHASKYSDEFELWREEQIQLRQVVEWRDDTSYNSFVSIPAVQRYTISIIEALAKMRKRKPYFLESTAQMNLQQCLGRGSERGRWTWPWARWPLIVQVYNGIHNTCFILLKENAGTTRGPRPNNSLFFIDQNLSVRHHLVREPSTVAIISQLSVRADSFIAEILLTFRSWLITKFGLR